MKRLDNPFGLLAFLHWYHDWNKFQFSEDVLKKAVDQLDELGMPIVRMDILWADVHRGVGKFDFSRYDKIIALLEKKGIHLLGLLQYNKMEDTSDPRAWSRPPTSFDEFAGYVDATVNRYKNWVKHWEIWNEPNHPEYWAEPRDGLKKYVDLLRHARTAAKQADPSCVVLNGGLTDPLEEDLNNFYVNGGKDLADILSIHTFVDPLAKDREERFETKLRQAEKMMDQHGDSKKKIWITEMGCPGVPDFEKHQKWFAGECVNEDQQAEWLEKLYDIIKKHPRIEKLFWAFYCDTDDNFSDATDYMGLVRKDLSPKASFVRLQRLIKTFPS